MQPGGVPHVYRCLSLAYRNAQLRCSTEAVRDFPRVVEDEAVVAWFNHYFGRSKPPPLQGVPDLPYEVLAMATANTLAETEPANWKRAIQRIAMCTEQEAFLNIADTPLSAPELLVLLLRRSPSPVWRPTFVYRDPPRTQSRILWRSTARSGVTSGP